MASKYLVVLGHYGHMGGAERQAFHLIRHLREQSAARVAALGWYGTEGPLADKLREWGCEVFGFPYKAIAPKTAKALNLLHLAHFIRYRIRPEFILPFVSVNSKPICEVWRLSGARFAWWNQQDEGRSMFGTWAEGRALNNASIITSNSIAGTQFLSETYGISEDRILTYNNGTELPDVARLQPVWRQRLRLEDETPLACMIANITPFKDHATLLRAWKLVLDEFARRGASAPFLAMAGFTKQTALVNELKVLAFDLGLGNSVAFVGAIDSTDQLMYESDLVVHSSLTEGCPNAVCEAMALGKPVVGTDIPGMRQALDMTCWERCLAEPRNPADLAAKIVQFLTAAGEARQVGAANRQRIERHFSVAGMCHTLLSQLPDHAR